MGPPCITRPAEYVDCNGPYVVLAPPFRTIRVPADGSVYWLGERIADFASDRFFWLIRFGGEEYRFPKPEDAETSQVDAVLVRTRETVRLDFSDWFRDRKSGLAERPTPT